MQRDEHTKIAKVENHLWEIAKLLNKEPYIDLKNIENAKESLLKIFKKQL